MDDSNSSLMDDENNAERTGTVETCQIIINNNWEKKCFFIF